MTGIRKLLWLAGPALIASACTDPGKTSEVAASRQEFFDKSGMDTTVSPGENFFLYANGTWIKKTEIPASERGWGSFYTLSDENTKNLKKIVEEISSKENDKGTTEQKVADF